MKAEQVGAGKLYVRCESCGFVSGVEAILIYSRKREEVHVSKYPVMYTSQSKGNLAIDRMHDVHLLNSYRKLVKEMTNNEIGADAWPGTAKDSQLDGSGPVREAMEAEMLVRGMNPDLKHGFPECPECCAPGCVKDPQCQVCKGLGVIRP